MVSVKIYALYLTNVPGPPLHPSSPSLSLLSPLAYCIVVDAWLWLWLWTWVNCGGVDHVVMVVVDVWQWQCV